MLAELVYLLCALTSASCALMLHRGYRRSGNRLLLWSGLCFLGLTLNNTLLFVDLVVMPEMNLSGTYWRNLMGAVSGSILLVGLIWELT